MATKTSNYPITSFDKRWGENKTTHQKAESPDRLPHSGAQVRMFLGQQMKTKIGYRYEDTTRDKYLYFADEEDCNKYLSDPEQYGDLIKWSEPMQKDYTAEIYPISDTTVSILKGTTGNYIEFDFDFLNRQGVSAGDSAIVTYNITNDAGGSQTVRLLYTAGTRVRFLVDDYLADGTNRIQVNIVGRNTLAATSASFVYNVIALSVSTEFDITKAQTKGEDFSFGIFAEGNGTKYVEVYLDGELISDGSEVITTLSGSIIKVVSLPSDMESGKHNIQVRAYVTSGLTNYYSKTLSYDFAVKGGSTPVVLFETVIDEPSETPSISAQQYLTTNIVYAMYDPSNMERSIVFDDADTIIATRLARNGRKDTVGYTPTASGQRTITATIDGTYAFELDADVKQSEIEMSKATTGLIFEVSAKGRSNNDEHKDEWVSGDYEATFNNVPFNSQCGWNNDALVLSNGATVEFNLQPLAANVARTGVTIEVDYEIDNGNSDDEAVVMDLLNTAGNGIKITPTYCLMQSADKANLMHLTMTGRRKHMAIIINRNSVDANKGMFMTMLNGKTSHCNNYTATTPFSCSKNLKFGDESGSCVVRIYGIRVYSRALTVEEGLGNYAIDSGDVISIANRNDICATGTTRPVFDKTKLKVASMRLIGDIEALLAVQDKTTTRTIEVDYYDPDDIYRCWHATNVVVKNQGTSTLKFPIKNFTLNFSNSVFTDIFGNVMEMEGIKLRDNSYPVLKMVAKCDYMESSASFNIAGALSFNKSAYDTVIRGTEGNPDTYPCRSLAQQYAAEHGITTDIRIAIDGKPIAMFYKQTERADEVCIGKYNLNNGKDDCPGVYGYEGLEGFDVSNTERWELVEEGGMCAFTAESVAHFDEEYQNYFEPVWGVDSPANLKRLCEWLASCEDDQEKFDDEYEDYLDPWKVAHYYLHIVVKNMGVDQMAKNMHLMTEDALHWFPIYYDGDSAKLNDNDGFQYNNLYADRQTTDESGNYYFQAHNSVLWNRVEGSTSFMAIVKQLAALEYSHGFNDAEEVDTFVTKHTALFPERLSNQNMEAKYFNIFRTTKGNTNYLYVSQGDKEERVRLLADRRLKRYEAMWGYGGYASRSVNFRLITGNDLTTEKAVVKAFDKFWFAYSSNLNMVESGIEINAGASHGFTIGSGRSNGDILRLHATDHMSELDMSQIARAMYSFEVLPETDAIHLKKLIIGNSTDTNSVVSQINGLGYLTALEELDIRNFSGINSLLGIENAINLHKLNASGTNLGVFAPASGVSLTSVVLPNTITDIVLNEATVTSLTYTPTSTLNALSIHGTIGINTYSMVNTWLTALGDDEELLSHASLKLDNVNWSANSAFLLKLAKFGTLELSGHVNLTDTMTMELYNALIEAFGESVFNTDSVFYIVVQPMVLLEGPSSVLAGGTAQYTAAKIPSAPTDVPVFSIVGSSAYASINSATGLLTVLSTVTQGTTITVKVEIGGSSKTKEVTISPKTYPTSYSIDGETQIDVAGEYDYEAVPNTEDYTGSVTYAWELTDPSGKFHIKSGTADKKVCTVEVDDWDTNYTVTQLKCIVTADNGTRIASETAYIYLSINAVTVNVSAGVVLTSPITVYTDDTPHFIQPGGVLWLKKNVNVQIVFPEIEVEEGDFPHYTKPADITFTTRGINRTETGNYTSCSVAVAIKDGDGVAVADSTFTVKVTDGGTTYTKQMNPASSYNLQIKPGCSVELEASKEGYSTARQTFTSTTSSLSYNMVINESVEIEAVDLGLPSGTKWANMNVGASAPEKAGHYFAWGGVVGYGSDTSDGHVFDWNNSPYPQSGTIPETLDAEHDAATANMGSPWRMPDKADYDELLANCDTAWTTRNGVNGRLFTSKINGKTLFFPASGFRNSSSLNNVGSSGRCWSRSLLTSNSQYARYLNFSSSNCNMGNDNRYQGYSVRGVQ